MNRTDPYRGRRFGRAAKDLQRVLKDYGKGGAVSGPRNVADKYISGQAGDGTLHPNYDRPNSGKRR
jgi:hypothetical protein